MQIVSLIPIFCIVIAIVFVIIGCRKIAAIMNRKPSDDNDCIGPVTVVSADGTVREDTSDCYELTVKNDTSDDLCVIFDGRFLILESGAIYKGYFCRGHHRMKVAKVFGRNMQKVGFSITQEDTISIQYSEGKYLFQ